MLEVRAARTDNFLHALCVERRACERSRRAAVAHVARPRAGLQRIDQLVAVLVDAACSAGEPELERVRVDRIDLRVNRVRAGDEAEVACTLIRARAATVAKHARDRVADEGADARAVDALLQQLAEVGCGRLDARNDRAIETDAENLAERDSDLV